MVILLADSDTDTLGKMFDKIKRILPCWGLQIVPENTQRGESINYLGYNIGLQKV